MDPGIFARGGGGGWGGGGGGLGGSRPNCQKTSLTKFFKFSTYFTVLQWYINGLFQRKGFRGGPTFSRGGGGVGSIFPVRLV